MSLNRTSLQATFQQFAAELAHLASFSNVHQKATAFRDLRDRYSRKFAEWRAGLEPAHKGLVLYVQDLDHWRDATALSDGLTRLTDLYQDTLAMAVRAEFQASRVYDVATQMLSVSDLEASADVDTIQEVARLSSGSQLEFLPWIFSKLVKVSTVKWGESVVAGRRAKIAMTGNGDTLFLFYSAEPLGGISVSARIGRTGRIFRFAHVQVTEEGNDFVPEPCEISGLRGTIGPEV